ncbi:MAG: hypothetical protein HN952_04780 [Candidatus Cloacimonetes bacterium]|jgi:hypothetical protein|nr:hypothetical protein [Candidatus Cloacimonadota bacterium]
MQTKSKQELVEGAKRGIIRSMKAIKDNSQKQDKNKLSKISLEKNLARLGKKKLTKTTASDIEKKNKALAKNKKAFDNLTKRIITSKQAIEKHKRTISKNS